MGSANVPAHRYAFCGVCQCARAPICLLWGLPMCPRTDVPFVGSANVVAHRYAFCGVCHCARAPMCLLWSLPMCPRTDVPFAGSANVPAHRCAFCGVCQCGCAPICLLSHSYQPSSGLFSYNCTKIQRARTQQKIGKGLARNKETDKGLVTW